jgi:hypothetical protein
MRMWLTDVNTAISFFLTLVHLVTVASDPWNILNGLLFVTSLIPQSAFRIFSCLISDS